MAAAVVAAVAVIALVSIDFYQRNRAAARPLSLRGKIYFSPTIREHCAMNGDANRALAINADRH